MTESPDDKVLDDYLDRDSAVSRAYRDMSTAEVPSAVDAAVLAQARAAVDRQQSKRRPAWTRWSAPVALAASVVLGVAVLLEVGVEERVYYPAAQEESEASDATAAAAIEQAKEQPAVAPSTPLPAPAPMPEPMNEAKQSLLKAERALARRKQEERADAAAGASFKPEAAPVPAPSAPPPDRSPSAASAGAQEQPPAIAESSAEVASTSPLQAVEADKLAAQPAEDERASAPLFARTRAEPARAPVPAAPAAIAERQASHRQMGQLSNAAAAPRLDPEAWLEQIRTLRREGKVLEADEQWKRFTETYPDVDVPASDFARPAPR